MDTITGLPEEPERILREGLVMIALAGKVHPRGISLYTKEDPAHSNDSEGNPSRLVRDLQRQGIGIRENRILITDPVIYGLKDMGYVSVVRSEDEIDMLQLTERGVRLYRALLERMDDYMLEGGNDLL